MTRVLANLHDRVEAGLFRRGFYNPTIRVLVRNQLYLAVGTTIPALALALRTWGWAYAAGVLLATLNFYALAKVVQGLVLTEQGTAMAKQLVQFYVRLLLTGLVLYVLIAVMKASIFGLVAGLTTAVFNIFIWGVFYVVGKS